MPVEDPLSDDLVAQILKKDAADSSLRYSVIGLQALLPKRPTSAAPKPNTRFLRNIIRETEGHNAALLAKEAAESRARLKKLQGAPESPKKERRRDDRHRHHRRIHRTEYDKRDAEYSRSKRRREYLSEDEDEDEHYGHSRHRRRDKVKEEEFEADSGRPKRRRADESGDEDENPTRRYHHRRPHRSRRDVGDDENGDKQSKGHSRDHNDNLNEDRSRRHSQREDRGRHRSRSRSNERSSRTHDKDREKKKTHRKHSHTPASSQDRERPHRGRRHRHSSTSPSRSASPRSEHAGHANKRLSAPDRSPDPQPSGDDSDPLDEIIGPAPPLAQPKIRSRGRGAFASASAMDTHFSNDYDPNIDVAPPSEDDDWEQALEAHRDRQKWKAQGAQRLREAGFTEVEVKKWEASGTGREKSEEDVVWAKRGEGREWDRGKVVDDEGEVALGGGLEWGRLKGT